MTSIPLQGIDMGVIPSQWPPLPERLLEAAVQGLSANITVDPKQPQQIASMAVAITEAVMTKVMGHEAKLKWHGTGMTT